ncbi:hypothetical protein Misp06_02111 [Microbulbifer sp. NBRC 101763]|uniref:right-handed parallel beta-helix repeat-containing protein n=1 Tax=Microbulbifer sp. NBRC 101763 TaxID=1113820 RepID=UPI0030AEFA4D
MAICISTRRAKSYIFLIFGIGISIPSISLAVDCYDEITSTVTLTEHLNCELSEDEPVALTIIGPGGSLSMNGFELNCTYNPADQDEWAGVRMEGTSGSIHGGSINSCPDGIHAVGSGSHSIFDMEITDFEDDGVLAESDFNNIYENLIIGQGLAIIGDGVDANGDYTSIVHNTIEGAGDEGVEIDGEYVNVSYNHISGSGQDGVEVDGDYASIIGNTLTNNGSDGIELEEQFALVTQNHVSDNVDDGIEFLGGSGNYVIQNTVTNNGAGSLDPAGIVVSRVDSINNFIIGNFAFDNFGDDLRDDFDPDCTGSNVWQGNFFGKASPTCLK